MCLARFETEGLSTSGNAGKGCHRKTSIPLAKIDEIAEPTLHYVPEKHTHWSCRVMAENAGVSLTTVQRIWDARGLKPNRVDTFKLSNDLQFEAKLIDVVGQHLSPPDKAVVLCMDEKIQIHALGRTQRSLPMVEGQAGFRPMPAPAPPRGVPDVPARRRPQRPEGLAVHLILDNATQAPVARRRRARRQELRRDRISGSRCYARTVQKIHDHHEESVVHSPLRADASKNQFTRRSFLLGSLAAAGAVALVGCSTSPGATSSSSPAAGSGSAVASGARAIRRITPPRLDTAYLGEKIHCYRPMRRGAPNLTVDVVGDKVIAHNYGHGGSGWTLAPGSAQYVIDLVQETERGRAIPKDADVTVVGAGVIGLFTAYELVKRGYTKVTVVAEKYDGLTSNNAGGLLAPVSMDNDPVMQAVIDKIGIDAYKFYAAVANGVQPDFDTGAVIVPAYFENREESGLEPYVGQVMEPAKDVVLDFGNGTTRDMVAYDDGIFMDTAVFMEALRDYLADKVTFETGKVDDLESLPSSLIFDCSGLGAGRLNGDAEMVSVQGHLMMLKDQVPADLQSMILVYYPKAKTTSGQEVKRSFYIFPKHLPGSGPNDVGVIGGTFIEGATPQTPNDEEFQIMIDGARNFYGI